MSHVCTAHHCDDPYCHRCTVTECSDPECIEIVSYEPDKGERQAWECEVCREMFCEDHTVDLPVTGQFLYGISTYCLSCAMTKQLAQLSMGKHVWRDRVNAKILRINQYCVSEFGADSSLLGTLYLSLAYLELQGDAA